MDIGNIAHLIKEEEDEQTRAAVRNSIFSEVEEYILNGTLKTHEGVVKSLKDRGVDCDNDNLSNDDIIKVSGLMELVDSMQKIKEEAKKMQKISERKEFLARKKQKVTQTLK